MFFQRCGMLAVLACVTSTLALAEPAPPPKLIETKLPIKASYPVKVQPVKPDQAEKATIHLPESVVRDLAARLNDKQSSAVPMSGGRGDSTQPSNMPHGATIIAGCMLSLAMIGFVLMRQRRTRWAWASGAAGVVLLGLVIASYTQANVAPPPEYFRKLEEAKNKCLIVIVPDGGDVEIFVPEK